MKDLYLYRVNKGLRDQLEILDLTVLMESLVSLAVRDPRGLKVFKDSLDPAVPRGQREHREDLEVLVLMEPEETQETLDPRELVDKPVMWEALEMMESKASKDLRVPRGRRERKVERYVCMHVTISPAISSPSVMHKVFL